MLSLMQESQVEKQKEQGLTQKLWKRTHQMAHLLICRSHSPSRNIRRMHEARARWLTASRSGGA